MTAATAPPSPPIPPLAHEVMGQVVAGFRKAIDEAVVRVRRSGWSESDLVGETELLDRSHFVEFVRPMGYALLDAGHDEDWVLAHLELLCVHAFYALSHELHRRKTFWVDESLAFMLAHTRLDVRGEGLRLPFASFALVFTDPETLDLCKALVGRDRDCEIRGLELRSLTVYVTRIPAARGTLGMHLSLLLDANNHDWPWMVTRDLDIAPDDVLDEIIESRSARWIEPYWKGPELGAIIEREYRLKP